MQQFGASLCLLILATACGGGDALLARPSRVSLPADPRVPPQPASPTPTVIRVGDEVKDTLTFHGANKFFELTARSDGTLVARLTWEPRQGSLELGLADRLFANFPDNSSPIVGKLPVAVGQNSRVRIADGARWDYDDLFVAFVLTTSME